MRKAASATIVLALLAGDAHAGQFLYNNGAGFRYSAPVSRGGWLAPRPSYLNGYVQPWRPSPGPFIAGAILGAAIPRFIAPPAYILPPMPDRSAMAPPAPAALPPPPPVATNPPDALEEVAPVNPQGITRDEVGNALVDWCKEARNAQAPLCVKMGARVQR